jgi:hypothetical protein
MRARSARCGSRRLPCAISDLVRRAARGGSAFSWNLLGGRPLRAAASSCPPAAGGLRPLVRASRPACAGSNTGCVDGRRRRRAPARGIGSHTARFERDRKSIERSPRESSAERIRQRRATSTAASPGISDPAETRPSASFEDVRSPVDSWRASSRPPARCTGGRAVTPDDPADRGVGTARCAIGRRSGAGPSELPNDPSSGLRSRTSRGSTDDIRDLGAVEGSGDKLVCAGPALSRDGCRRWTSRSTASRISSGRRERPPRSA